MLLAALPWLAFIEGHPFRIRYMVPLIAIEAIGAGYAVEMARRVLEPRFSLRSASSAFIARERRQLMARARKVGSLPTTQDDCSV